MSRFIPHLRVLRVQRKIFKEMRSSLRPGEVILVLDFQERITHQHQDEAQGEYFAGVQTVLFPVIAYFLIGDEVWAYSFTVMSDDLEQDNAWVQHTLEILLRDRIPAVLEHAGAHSMQAVFIFSDNCCPQFKNLFNFYFNGGPNVANVENNSPRLHVEWHFWAACHGKNVSDSEGATIKNVVKEREKNGQWRESTSRALYDRCSTSELRLDMHPATPAERSDFFGGDNEARGGIAQLVTTKVNVVGQTIIFILHTTQELH